MHHPNSPTVEPGKSSKGIGSETEVHHLLETVEKSTQLANQNLAQQNSISYQQALTQIAITGISKCFEWISLANPAESHGQKRIETYRSMIDQLNHLVQTAAKVANQTFQSSTDSEMESHGVPKPDSPRN
jgi:hypothetical protein